MNKRSFGWMNPKLEIEDTGRYGKGAFAKEDIRKGDILFVVGGYILTVEDENTFGDDLADKPMELSDYFSIGPLKPSHMELMPSHIVNHSCDPNVGFKGQVFLVAMRKIKKGEELAYDYAMSMHPHSDRKLVYTIECRCGSKKCRGTVTEHDWKIPDLQKRYDGYFQWFLQEKINRLARKRR